MSIHEFDSFFLDPLSLLEEGSEDSEREREEERKRFNRIKEAEERRRNSRPKRSMSLVSGNGAVRGCVVSVFIIVFVYVDMYLVRIHLSVPMRRNVFIKNREIYIHTHPLVWQAGKLLRYDIIRVISPPVSCSSSSSPTSPTNNGNDVVRRKRNVSLLLHVPHVPPGCSIAQTAASLWDSAFVLARYLQRHDVNTTFFRGKRVIGKGLLLGCCTLT